MINPMERLVLINPPIGRYDVSEIAPPLGLLRLATAAASAGREVRLLDLNLPGFRAWADQETFYERALEAVAELLPTAVAITSMGVNTHVAVKLASLIARSLGCPAEIGGVHATSIATTLQGHHPDVIVDRNGVNSPYLKTPSDPRDVSTALAKHVSVSQYFDANPRRLANLESGRGCRYNCAFCYSPVTYGGWSTADPSTVVEAFRRLEAQGFEHVFLVDDNLLNSADWFIRMCSALELSRSTLTWNGYATLRDLNEDLLDHAVSAGCVNLYVGVDVVDPQQQRDWSKTFYHGPSKLDRLLKHASEQRLTLTCAYILDLRPEADFFTTSTLDAALSTASVGADTRLSVLTPYPGTRLGASQAATPLTYSSSRAQILFDLPAIVTENRYAQVNPAAFPWHTRPATIAEDAWTTRLLAVHAAQVLLREFRVLPAALRTGQSFWRHCLTIAAEEQRCDFIHKTELKTLVRTLHTSIAA